MCCTDYVSPRRLYDSEGESADQEECVCVFLIIDDEILQPAGLLCVAVVAAASLGKLNCCKISIFASICLEISWTPLVKVLGYLSRICSAIWL